MINTDNAICEQEGYKHGIRNLLEGDELAKHGNIQHAIDTYWAGAIRASRSTGRDAEVTVALLHCSLAEMYRARPHLAPHATIVKDLLVAADLDGSLSLQNPQESTDPVTFGLAYLVNRCRGMDLLGELLRPGCNIDTAVARLHLQRAEAALCKQVVIEAADEHIELGTPELRKRITEIDPVLADAIYYTDQVRDHRRLDHNLQRSSTRTKLQLALDPRRPKLSEPHAVASYLAPNAA